MRIDIGLRSTCRLCLASQSAIRKQSRRQKDRSTARLRKGTKVDGCHRLRTKSRLKRHQQHTVDSSAFPFRPPRAFWPQSRNPTQNSGT